MEGSIILLCYIISESKTKIRRENNLLDNSGFLTQSAYEIV